MPAVIINIIILILGAVNFALVVHKRKAAAFAFYTQLSNYAALAAAILFLLAFKFQGLIPAAEAMRFLSSVMLGMTFFVVMAVLIPMGAGAKNMLWGSGFFVHLLVPWLSIISTLFLENDPSPGLLLFPPVTTLIYGLIMMILNYQGKADGPYPFFWVRRQSKKATVLWTAALFGAVLLISFLMIKGAAALPVS